MSSTAGVPREWPTQLTGWCSIPRSAEGSGASTAGPTIYRVPKCGDILRLAKIKGGVCLSEDGGKSWKKSNDGMEETAATHILLDPTSPRMQASYMLRDWAMESTKFGWRPKLEPQESRHHAEEPFAWRLARAANGTLYVLIARRSENGSIGNSGDGALYKSTDGAEHWQPVALPAGTNAPNGMAIDPEDSNRLYSLPGHGRLDNMEMAEAFSSRKMRAKPGNKCSTRIATFMTSPSTLRIRPFFMLWASNRRHGALEIVVNLDPNPRLQFQVGTTRNSRSHGSQ